MKIKVCGITNLKDALMCEKYGADALGFIFYKKSKRYIEPAKAKNIINKLSPFTLKVGVFVNESIGFINDTASNLKLHAIQLHGDETQDIVNSIKLPVIKSFRVNNDFNFLKIQEFKNCYYLLDSFSEQVLGGTGITFNWDKIPKELNNHIILSGGISIENIENIFEKINPRAIDISSSLELSAGKKSQIKVKEFFYVFNELRNKSC